MKKFLILCLACLIFGWCYTACGDETVTYYLDENGNGREDWGEAVWYEDEDGAHLLD